MRLFEGTPWDRPPRCENCEQLDAECTCPPVEPSRRPPEKQTARLALEKRGKGKMVTVIRGLSPADNDLTDLLTRLKSTCGAGGAIKDEVLEIQGSQLERVRELLSKLGYRVKG